MKRTKEAISGATELLREWATRGDVLHTIDLGFSSAGSIQHSYIVLCVNGSCASNVTISAAVLCGYRLQRNQKGVFALSAQSIAERINEELRAVGCAAQFEHKHIF